MTAPPRAVPDAELLGPALEQAGDPLRGPEGIGDRAAACDRTGGDEISADQAPSRRPGGTAALSRSARRSSAVPSPPLRGVEHADAVITRLGEAERELAEIAGLEGGRLRLVSFPTASATLMTQAMSELRPRHPRIELHFAEGEPEDSVPAVKRGGYDLALAFDFVAFPEDFGRDTDSELIFTDPMRVALPPGHPLAQMETVDLSALADEEWLCGEAPSSCRAHVINACRAAGFEPRISFESDDYQVIQGLVAAGLGVGLIPELAQPDPAVVLRDIAPDPPIRRVWVVTRSAATRSDAVDEMLAILRDVGAAWARERKLQIAS